jgi:hypothetical protein
MPEPNRSPALVDQGLNGIPFWMLIEQRATLRLECEACHHVAIWTPEWMHAKFYEHHRGKTVRDIASRLRCPVPKCRSDWVWIVRDYKARRGAPISKSEGERP